ncbi:MAG: AsmA family protein [Methyloprofundus sp.]|nr:AsmA family protein [Methyloprofundus sp.]
MHKIKIILLSLTGIIVVFVAIMAFILSSYKDQDFQSLLIQTVDNLSDYTLSIKGPFELQRSFTPTLSATEIELRSKTDASYIYIGNFRIQLSLSPLLDNTLLINDLLLEDMRVELQSSEQKQSSASQSSFPFTPVIEHAVLKNIQLTLDNDEQVHTLDNLVISAKDRQAPLKLHATGISKGRTFAIEGQLGPLADIFAQDIPYPINLIARWEQVQLSINGSINDFAHEKRLDLVGKLNIPEVADVYAIAGVKGHLQSSVHIKGSFAEPMLAEISTSIEDKQQVLLQMTGTADNPQNQTVMHFSGFIHDPKLLKRIMPDDSPSLNSFKIAADISQGNQDTILQNIDIKLSNDQGFELKLTGNTHVNLQDQAFSSLKMQASISSNDTVTVKPFLGNILPEMGPVTGSAQITNEGKGLVLSHIDLVVGANKKVQLKAKGLVGGLSMDSSVNNLKIAIELALKTATSSELTSLLEITHPEIGPVSMTASLNGSTDQLKLSAIKLKAGISNILSFQADGWISWDELMSDSPQQLTDITIQSQMPSLQKGMRIYAENVPDLGPAKFSVRIHGKGEVLKGSDLSMRIGTKNSLSLVVQGEAAQIFIADIFYKGIDLTGTLSAKSSRYLSKLLEGNKIPDIGPLSGKFTLKGDSNILQVPSISLSAGRKKQLMLTASGKIAQIPLREQTLPQGVTINLAVTAPSSAELSKVLGSEIPDFGALAIKGLLTNNKETYAIKDLLLTAGPPQQAAINLSGSIEDILSKHGMQMTVQFDEKILVKLFDLHPAPELGQLKGNILLSDAGGDFGIKDITIESENSELINVKISAAIDNNVPKTGDLSLNADIAINHPALFGKLFAIDLSGLGPISSSGLIGGNKDRVTFKGNSIIGRTKLNSELAISLINEKPDISGTINSPNIFLEDFGVSSKTTTPAQKQSAKVEQSGVFSHTPISLQVLHNVDLNLQLRLFQITGIDYKLDRVNIDLLLRNGKLTASPVKFIFSEGQFTMSAKVNAREKPEWSLNMQAEKILLSQLFVQQHESSPLDGEFNFVVDLKSLGISAHEIAANLNGEAGFTLENGSFNRSQLELVFLNPLGWLFSQGLIEDEMHISCGLARYQVKQGIVRSKIFLIDGPKLLVRGKTETNLAKETINSLYNLEKKNILDKTIIPTIRQSSIPIKISGSLSDPLFELAPLPSVISTADRYIFAPIVTIPQEVLGTVLGIFDNNKDEQSPCDAYLEE